MVKPALLVIDVQTGLVTGAHREAEVLKNINAVISRIREQHGIIVFIQHCHSSYEPLMKGNPGWEVHPTLEQRSEDLVIEKTASDSFFDTMLNEQLRSNKVDHIYVTGLQTEYCVDTTCRSALSKGYRVTLVSDAHTTGDAQMKAAQIIEYHNSILANLAHPLESIAVVPSSKI